MIQEFRDCNEVFRSVEVWTYPNQSRGAGTNKELQFLFYRPSFGAPRKLWYPAIPDRETPRPVLLPGSATQACRPAGAQGGRPAGLLPEKRRPADLRCGLRRRRA